MTNKEKEFYLLLLGWVSNHTYNHIWMEPDTKHVFSLDMAYRIATAQQVYADEYEEWIENYLRKV